MSDQKRSRDTERNPCGDWRRAQYCQSSCETGPAPKEQRSTLELTQSMFCLFLSLRKRNSYPMLDLQVRSKDLPTGQLIYRLSVFASGIPSQSFHLPSVQTSGNFIFSSLRTSRSQFVALPERLYFSQAPQSYSCPSIGIKTLPSYSRRIFRNLLLILQFAPAFQTKHLGIEWVCRKLAASFPDPEERFDTPSCFYI